MEEIDLELEQIRKEIKQLKIATAERFLSLDEKLIQLQSDKQALTVAYRRDKNIRDILIPCKLHTPMDKSASTYFEFQHKQLHREIHKDPRN